MAKKKVTTKKKSKRKSVTKTTEDIGYVCAKFLNDAVDRIVTADENDDGYKYMATTKDKALEANAKQLEYEGAVSEDTETVLYKVTVTKVAKFKYKPASMVEV